ncbi:6050_t:CDS:2 [Entrophospora sp. SA101]|nr:6050_t:CDS:2 [Entrophospora sp. SA101]
MKRFAPEILPIEPALDNLYVELNIKNAKSESSYIVFILLADVERMKYIIQKYTMIQLSKVEKQLELILNMPVYLQDCQTQNQYLLTNDINDLDNDETEVVEEENNQDIDLLSSQLDLQKTIFCCAIRMVHESQLPKSDGENYFLDRMSPNEIYLLRYSEIKQLLLEDFEDDNNIIEIDDIIEDVDTNNTEFKLSELLGNLINDNQINLDNWSNIDVDVQDDVVLLSRNDFDCLMNKIKEM